MDIDLLFTQSSEAGLICSENLVKKAVGALLDTQAGLMSLEFNDMDYMEFNIPVESEYFARLEFCQQLHIGAVKEGQIAQAYQVPLMFMDDPYRAEAYGKVQQPRNPLRAFGYFVNSCVTGQPVHREDLGDEDKMGCILGEATPGSLEFAPHLARRHAMEAAPKAAPSGGPSGPGPSGMGSGGGGRQIIRGTGQPPKDDD